VVNEHKVNLEVEAVATAKLNLNSGAYRVENHTAIIPIMGTLVNRSFGLNSLSGLTTYASIREQFNAALADKSVKQILLDINSPGGEVSGLFDLVDELYKNDAKPLIAYVNEGAFSAAYAIASAADKIYLSRTAGVGSIGVIAVHADESERDKKAGITYTAIYAGSRKNDFNPHEPLTKEAKEALQTRVDSTYDLFVKTVARNRSLSIKDITGTEASTFFGEDAITSGLADKVITQTELINFLGGTNTMPNKVKEKTEAAAAPELTEVSAETMEIVDDMIEEELEAQAEVTCEMLKTALILANGDGDILTNLTNVMIDLIHDQADLQTINATFQNAMAQYTTAAKVQAQHTTTETPQKSPLVINAEKRAAEVLK
jgi:signal peptide peptidase SppA